jgi:hypothetical protein
MDNEEWTEAHFQHGWVWEATLACPVPWWLLPHSLSGQLSTDEALHANLLWLF